MTGTAGALARFGLDRPRGLLAWTILIGTLVRLAAAALTGSTYAEAYYLSVGRHFALSYFDQPPLSLWLIWATMKLTGSDSVFVLRVAFILLFILTSWLVYRLGASLFDERVGAFAALLLNISPLFTLGIGEWLLTEGPLMPAVLGFALCLARLAFGPPADRRLPLWAAAGFCIGLAMLSKYSAVLVAGGAGLFALSKPEYRRWFLTPGPYLALAVAVVVFSPVLIWNWQHHWVSFGFQGGRLGEPDAESRGLYLHGLIESLGGQFLAIGPWIWIPMVQIFAAALARGPRDARSWFLCCTGGPTIVLFTLVALVTSGGGSRFHWQAPGYLLLFPLTAHVLAQNLLRGNRISPLWLLGSTVATALVIVVLVSEVATGWMQRFAASLSPRWASIHDPTIQMTDWTELRDELKRRGLIEQPNLFVVTTHRYFAGKADVVLGRWLPTACLCDDPRDIAFGWDHRRSLGWNAVIVGPNLSSAAVRDDYGKFFGKIDALADVAIHRAGETVLTLNTYYATDYRQPYPLPIEPRH